MGRKRTDFDESAILNNTNYQIYLDRLFELAISVFEWQNLPDTVDERFLEYVLNMDGKAVFFKDEEMGYLALQCAYAGGFDVYREPLKVRAYAVNGYNRTMDNQTECVLIWNNKLRKSTMPVLMNYATQLWDLDRTCYVNLRAQKTPILVIAPEHDRLTMKNLYKEIDGNSPVIYGDKNLDYENIKAINTGAPFIADQVYSQKVQIWNEALSYLGISSINSAKKERMVTDEVIRNMGATVMSRYSRLDMRKRACEEINKLFGTDIWVEFKEDYDAKKFNINELNMVMDEEEKEEKEGGEDE